MRDAEAAAALAQRLLRLLHEDDVDGAIDAGLMAFDGGSVASVADRETIAAAQRRLRDAWAARERCRAREARLARRAAVRLARRAQPQAPTGEMPALPPAAAAALARAKARAAGQA